MNLKVLAMAAVVVLPGPAMHHAAGINQQTPPVAHGQATPTAGPRQPDNKSKPAIRPDDYIKPIDGYLEGTPMAGTGRYFYAAEQKYHVKKELLMAIAYAETNYNRNPQRGSQFNAFSICSYDSTNTTCHYGSYEQVIDEAARILTDSRTPIGRMNYANIGQLSRASNPAGPIWAASTHNWQANTVSEVSRITGKRVDATWNWRSQ